MHRSEWRTFYSPDSSNIKSVSYAEALRELLITFNNASKYTYADVPTEVYEELRDAESVGHAFNLLVKGKYEYSK